MFYSQKAFGVVGARPFGSYGRETRKKTAKSYAALRHEISLGPMKKNAAFWSEGGINIAG
jgi:hypothetical protein